MVKLLQVKKEFSFLLCFLVKKGKSHALPDIYIPYW